MATVEFYLQREGQFQERVRLLDKTIRQYALTRLLVALMVLFLFYLGLKETLLFYPMSMLVVLFFFLVQKQSTTEEDKKILLQLALLNEWESAACRHDFKNFPQGEQYVDPNHPFSHDLDIFGSDSLFQYLNRCATKLGEAQLAEDLTHLQLQRETVLQRQAAIRELGPSIDFRQHCWARGKQIQDADFDLESLGSWLKQPSLFHGKKIFLILRWGLPFVTCLTLSLAFFNRQFQSVFLFLLLLQLTITSFYNKPITRLQNDLSVYRMMLENYSKIFQLMKGESFTSSIMKGHQRIAGEATAHVRALSRLINAIESRMNVIARIFGNGLFLYDFHTVSNLEAWREQHARDLPLWLESLAAWDALLSLATFHYNHPHFAFAEINEKSLIKGSAIGHPLIPAAERINNNFDLGDPANVMLITGANMAGKSTFLRAIGVNHVLACNGAPVCAAQWTGPLMPLRTGMRTSDSLHEHQSYFYAELNRLKSIMDQLKAGEPLIILLDEILKGTNSTDKQNGSRALIHQLIDQNALVLIATHDIALGDLEAQYPDGIVNTCFEGEIENDQLTFDYQLHGGVAQKANATFLMKKMGIIP